MSLRINPDPAPHLLAAIALNRQAQNTALHQISTGQAVNQLSDNPAAAAEVVLNHVQSSQNGQFLQNLTSLQTEGETIHSTLNSAVQVLTQAIQLGTEGANGTLSDADRQGIASQLVGIRNPVLSFANQTDQGNYVFAGTATSTQPFVLDPTQPDGVKYNGNTNVNSVEISSGQIIPINSRSMADCGTFSSLVRRCNCPADSEQFVGRRDPCWCGAISAHSSLRLDLETRHGPETRESEIGSKELLEIGE